MLEPQPRGNGPCVSQQDPELQERQAADPSDCEKSNPLDAGCRAQAETSRCQPEPPCRLEGLEWTLFVLVRKARPGKCSEGRENDEGRIEENQARLGNKRIVCLSLVCIRYCDVA